MPRDTLQLQGEQERYWNCPDIGYMGVSTATIVSMPVAGPP